MRVVLRLFALLAVLSFSLLPPSTSARSSHRTLERYAVILVVDGARPDYFRLAPMPYLGWLLRRGVTYTRAFVGQGIANTPPSHATIGTGLFPKHHGVEGFVWKDPRTDSETRPTETAAVVNGVLEQVMAARR